MDVKIISYIGCGYLNDYNLSRYLWIPYIEYQTTADQLTIVDKQVVVQMKRDRFSESLEGYKIERVQLKQFNYRTY